MSRFVPLSLLLTLFACGQDDDPTHAKELRATITAGAGYRTWRRAPGYPTRRPSFTAHADAVEIFVNDEISRALDGPEPRRDWPVGAIIVKDGYTSDSLQITAVMEKRADGWFWVEYDGDGNSLFSGKPKVCVDCHDNRKDYSDWVYAFELPR